MAEEALALSSNMVGQCIPLFFISLPIIMRLDLLTTRLYCILNQSQDSAMISLRVPEMGAQARSGCVKREGAE